MKTVRDIFAGAQPVILVGLIFVNAVLGVSAFQMAGRYVATTEMEAEEEIMRHQTQIFDAMRPLAR